jgi:transposase
MVCAHRIKLLKQTVQLSEHRERLSELDQIYQNLQQKKQAYERAGEALLKSALSVYPDNQVYSSENLHQRSAWVEKACELRRYTRSNTIKVTTEIDALTPQYHTSLGMFKFLEEKKTETEVMIERERMYHKNVAQNSELEDVCEISLIYRSRGGKNI